MTADHAYKFGRYLGWYYNQNHKGRIVLGKDTGRSSYMYEYALVTGITASGSDVYMLHVTTTPSVAYVVRTENFDCGIMVSASHNPFYDNGIKVMDGNEPDGTKINMNCGSTHIENLQQLVKARALMSDLLSDGDADRCIAVDENGNEVNGDFILYICGKYLKECDKLRGNTVVATIMSNIGLYKALENEGINCHTTTVGDKYVNEALVANGYVLGGEQSGHIIFSKHATTGDGILTAIMIMEVTLEKKQSLAALCSGIKMYPQYMENVRVNDKKVYCLHQ